MNKQITGYNLLSHVGHVEGFISRYKQKNSKLKFNDLVDINDIIKAIVKLSKEIRKQKNA
jgi:uncharacterized radical SAM superfamily protein